MPNTERRELGALEVADSFLVVDGATAGSELHRRRFLEASGFSRAQWDTALAGVPMAGTWFPRLEKRRGAREPALLLRPAPPRFSTVTVGTAARDPRRSPRVKGPDLERLGRLRQDAHARGADEAIILSNGFLVEGAGSSLVWWRAGELRVVAREFARMPSVTEHLVLALAAEDGIKVAGERSTPAELAGVELWVLSSLHGIRAVTSWVDGPLLAPPDMVRLERWRARWAALARPIGAESTDAESTDAEPIGSPAGRTRHRR